MHESFKYRKVIMLECFTLPNIYRPQRSCGKVIFSQACVKNSVHREGCAWQGVCMVGGMHGSGRHVWQGGACMAEGHAWQMGHAWWGVCMVVWHVW